MFICELCNSIVPPGTRAKKVITETRPTEYPSRNKAQQLRIGRKMKRFDDPGGAGYEIANEVMSCRSCASSQPETRITS